MENSLLDKIRHYKDVSVGPSSTPRGTYRVSWTQWAPVQGQQLPNSTYFWHTI